MYILITVDHFLSKSRLIFSRTLSQVPNVVTFIAVYSQMQKIKGKKNIIMKCKLHLENMFLLSLNDNM